MNPRPFASSSSRRSFLKTALAAGVSPLILPGRIWSAETKPGEKLGVGVIGVGKQAGGHIGGLLKRADVQVLAVCDVDTTRRENGKRMVDEYYTKKAAAGSYQGAAAYNDFRELLARKDLDAVVIVTPDHWHAPITIAAANAGKDIYCEKPLCQTVHESAAMVAAVRKNARVFQTGSQQRSSREFRVACELVRNGVIGKISRVETGFGGPGKWCDLPEEAAEPGLDWNLWLGPAPMRPYNSVLSPRGIHNHFPQWRAYWEYGGGLVTDWGAHHVDIAQWGLGVDEDSGPEQVIPPAEYKSAQAGAKLIYPGGVELTHIKENGVTFFGSDGEIYVNRGKFALKLKGEQKARSLGKDDKPSLKEQLDAVENEFLKDAKVRLTRSEDHRGNWIECIRSRQDPICKVEIGTRTVNSCHLLNMAYRYGQKFQWDPKRQDFASGGNPKWLTRDYRSEWRVA
jgi:predicted dehydrogenase